MYANGGAITIACSMPEELLHYIEIMVKTLGRYLMVATTFFVVFYIVLKHHHWFVKIQERFPNNKDYAREVFYSALSVIIFASIALFVFSLPHQYVLLYRDFDAYPVWYYALSFVLMLLVHDTYFYWMHRFMHLPRLFKWFHLTHHKSTNPSPWAAYAFHPLEAVIEGAIPLVIVQVMPVHTSALTIFFIFQIIYNVYGHLGYELYPKGFARSWVGRYINTSVNHNLHHKYFKGSYGLYFTIWDRLMGTMHPKYDHDFERVTATQAAQRAAHKLKVEEQ